MPDITQSILPRHNDRCAGAIPLPPKTFCDGFHAHLDARTNVHGEAITAIGGKAEHHRLSDVGNMHKITAFLTVLEQDNLFALPDPIGKDRKYAGVGVVERLAFSINILQSEHQERDAK